jgi:hypothetical protein
MNLRYNSIHLQYGVSILQHLSSVIVLFNSEININDLFFKGTFSKGNLLRSSYFLEQYLHNSTHHLALIVKYSILHYY